MSSQNQSAGSDLGGRRSNYNNNNSTAGVPPPDPVISTSTNTLPRRTEPQRKGQTNCKFWGSGKACRAGDACPFLHDASRRLDDATADDGGGGGGGGGGGSRPSSESRRRPDPPASSDKNGDGPVGRLAVGKSEHSPQAASVGRGRKYVPPSVPSGNVVAKPVPAQDPRLFQIGQIKRRYNALETATATEGDATVLTFTLHPSDPDFPYDLAKGLKCVLHVPSSYLERGESGSGKNGEGKPWLDVKNAEMGRGYQINIEKGFAKLVERSPGLGLLGWMKELDKGLEALLAMEKAEVVTIIPNIKSGKRLETGKRPAVEVKPAQSPQENTARPASPRPIHTPAQLQEASSRREMETRQLEARVGRLPLFSKSGDGIAYTVPVTPRKPGELPVPLQGVKAVKLFVPLLYPLQHCRIELQDASREAAKKTELGFERRAKDERVVNLMGHVNWLAQNMHVLATAPEKDELDKEETAQVEKVDGAQDLRTKAPEIAEPSLNDDDRSHIKVIPRPPEWSTAQSDEDDASDSYDSDADSSDSDENDAGPGVAPPQTPDTAPATTPERGVSLNFPNLELHGIELLELTSLSITIRCERCKTTQDISNLRTSTPSPTTIPAKPRLESCKKCASPFSITYRHTLMHPPNAFRAGYLDLTACTVLDLLPSTFVPTCSACSTPLPPPGVISVRGASTLAICRECHRKLSLHIPEVKFQLVSASNKPFSGPSRRRLTPKENLGITAGTELPRRGRCSHYAKSYRWFRFSCCGKVYPCDRCHDGAETHPNEHAHRMICGWCSREQNYRPEACGVCGKEVVRKRGSGFWEGGKGTREKARMSRKDPRKYKRMPGGAVRHT